MALVACRECKNPISAQAKVCPSCGAKQPRRHGVLQWTFLGLVTVVIVSCIASNQTDHEERVARVAALEAAKSPQQRADEAAAKQRDDSNLQSALKIARVLKRKVKDPESFKLTSLLLFDSGEACFEYTAKNAFGGTVQAKAVSDGKSKILGSESDGNQFVAAWNKTCTHAGGHEHASGLNLLGQI